MLVAALLVSCAPYDGPPRVEVATEETGAAWLSDPRLDERTLAVAQVAARCWGGGGDLAGWTIRFVGEIGSCGAAPAGARIQGCTRAGDRIVDVRVDPGSPCVEATSLLHEMGHVVLGGDPGHADPRWSDGEFWSSLLSAVGGEIPPDDARCVEAVAAWRVWWGGEEPRDEGAVGVW
jgi:hypothetical protein